LRQQAFEAGESAQRIVGVDRCNAAGVASIPSFQDRMSLGAPNFANNNAGGLQPHAGTEAVDHRYVTRGVQIDVVRHRALQLGRIFNDQNPVMRR
jgi:hypothetical protein